MVIFFCSCIMEECEGVKLWRALMVNPEFVDLEQGRENVP